MKLILLSAIAVQLSFLRKVDRSQHPINPEIVEKIKKSNVNWKPMEVEDNPFKDLLPEEI